MTESVRGPTSIRLKVFSLRSRPRPRLEVVVPHCTMMMPRSRWWPGKKSSELPM